MLKRELPLVSLTPLRTRAFWLAFALLALFAAPAHAQLRNHELRFVPPADARVIGFHVYVSGSSMSYADYRDDINFVPPVGSGGYASYVLSGLEAYENVYIALRSYDDAGGESVFSNEIVLPAQQECLVTGCNDGNSCTVDTCEATGCRFDPAPRRGSACDDGNPNTFADTCTLSGACVGTQSQCNVDADCPAPANFCAGPQVCNNHVCQAGASPQPNGTTCNDGNAGTRYDICESGMCRGYACGSDAHCGDGEACNGTERCLNRTCVAGTPMVCGDGDVCNGNETCRNSACVAGAPLSCPVDDGPCFDAFCDPAQGCRVTVYPNGTQCTTSGSGTLGQCSSGVCVADTPPPTEDPRDPRPDTDPVPTACDNAFGQPTNIRQELTADPELTRKVAWSATLHPMGSVLQYRHEAATTWKSLRAVAESWIGCDAVYSVTLTGLKPRSRYFFRVSGASDGGRVWSSADVLRTGSADPRQRFKFGYFSGNGLRESAQSPLASHVLAGVDKGNFPLVLGGGGYTLSSEAIAAGAAPNAAAAVATWKQRAGVVTRNSIFTPVLGDTEVESFAHAERAADYADYMRTATGSAAPHGSYSYDFGGVHFLAVHAPNLGTIHPGTTAGMAHLAWIDADLAAARAAGARWIVVYMHADLFSSESSTAATSAIRQGVGAVLLRHHVNLVLSGDADSYERTRPLRGNLGSPTLGPTGRAVLASDGIVFVRAGSGGRTVFGRWTSPTPPAWSEERDNTRAVFLSLSADDLLLRVTAYGFLPDGSKQKLDEVEIR